MPNVLVAALVSWLAVVSLLGARDAFVVPPGEVPLVLVAGVALPLVAFFAALRVSAFRRFVLGADLRLVVSIHAWRALGYGFLALYAYGLLPGLFAWPAAVGDVAIALTAPWIARTLGRDPGFVHSRSFALWNVFGVLDLVLALTLGMLTSGLVPGLVEVTSAPMARLPFVVVPVFLVPIMLMLHATALLQARSGEPVTAGRGPRLFRTYPETR